ncbi:MAG: alpha-glucosidase/alpha-galactosidase [Elusimicrobia bacterium RIFOXYA2_FULL_40_6]|nr:MAG: alpha-glucosidase/alpha-galactosidase [Elusimicrobia bacterium RIFOXYA2_FULL_40_6]
MVKIAIIGAGSAIFSKDIIMDVLDFKELQGSTFSLMDINAERAELTKGLIEKFVKQENLSAKIEATTNRREALKGADFVILTIDTPGTEVIKYDVMIPYKYGIDVCIGDSMGAGGVFKGMRLIPIILDICRDIEKLCPNAIVMNYVNPMAMVTWAINKYTSVKVVGLCHSVQKNSKALAQWVGIPPEEIDVWAAGINHMSWFLKLEWKGKSFYPKIWNKLHKPGVFEKQDKFRFEMMKSIGYYMTETSGHFSEYVPYFRKRKDIIKKLAGKRFEGESLFYYHYVGKMRKDCENFVRKQIKSKEKLPLEHSMEYAAEIVNAAVTNKTFRFNGNVENTGMVTNLPNGCCVEIPCFVDRLGIHPCYVGTLPPQCAALNKSNINVQEMAVQAVASRKKEDVHQAVLLDPLTSAVLAPWEIRKMVDEMFKAEEKWLPKFK